MLGLVMRCLLASLF